MQARNVEDWENVCWQILYCKGRVRRSKSFTISVLYTFVSFLTLIYDAICFQEAFKSDVQQHVQLFVNKDYKEVEYNHKMD